MVLAVRVEPVNVKWAASSIAAARSQFLTGGIAQKFPASEKKKAVMKKNGWE
jgi:hypothetical protein